VHPLSQGDKQDPFDLSRKVSAEEMRFLLLQAHSEIKFLMWYLFSFKFNTVELSQKKKALAEFYDYVRLLETELERDEFLRAAASDLSIDVQILRKDFTAFAQFAKPAGGFIPVTDIAYQESRHTHKPKAVSKQEKEIIAMLLRFPELANEELLLAEIPWESETAYLLYSFFHDRLKTGEAYNWQNLNTAMEHLPDNLAALLAEIVMDYETAFEKPEAIRPEEAKRNLQQLVRSSVLQSLDKRIRQRQEEIARRERMGADVEELMLEQQQDIDKRLQWHRMK